MSKSRLQLQGKTFSFLTAVDFIGLDKNKNSQWKCKCVCGEGIIARGGYLVAGRVKSCGCKNRDSKYLATEIKCVDCGQLKNVNEFSINFKTKKGQVTRKNFCLVCDRKRQRKSRLMRIFNLAIEDYDLMFKTQNGQCAICKKPLKKAQIDHKHFNGLIRGLLCWLCNKILGLSRDNPKLLRDAAIYLEHPPAIEALGAPRYGRPGRVNQKIRKKKSK